MNKYIKAIMEIKSYTRCNMFIYYIAKIPFLGGGIGRVLFANSSLKKLVEILMNLLSVLCISIIKLLCVVGFVLMPVLWFSAKAGLEIADYSPYYIQIIFFLFCILGSFQESRTFIPCKSKYICLTHFKMEVKGCLLSFITVEYFMQFLSITIVFAICSKFLFASKWVLAVLLIEYISLQLASEALHLYMFKKNNISLEKNKVYNIFLLVFSLACAYGPLVSSRVFIYSIIKNPFFVMGAGILGILSVYYIYFGFNGYNSELASVFKREDLKEELAKKAQESILYNDISIEMSIPEKAKGLHGFDLLNCIFFTRHKKSLYKYFKRRMIVFALVTISAILWSFNDFSSAHNILGNIYKFIPVIPIMLSQLSYGEGFCKFSYNHCDSQLMSYSFYKTKTAVFSNYLIRLKEVLKYNMLLGITMLGCFLLILSFAGINIGSLKMILFILTLFCLLLMFGVHHVSIYYLIQPYVKDSIIQNPNLFMMQLPLFFLNYMMLMLNVSPVLIMALLLLLCIVYPVVLIVLVRCKGERTFILK